MNLKILKSNAKKKAKLFRSEFGHPGFKAEMPGRHRMKMLIGISSR
jgi:hypothetical protein